MKIRELLKTLEDRQLPLIEEDTTIKEVLKKMLQYPHTRLLYVVNKEGMCKGTISLEILVRHLFPRGFEPAIHPRFLIPMITSETAKDIMNKRLLYATHEDTVEAVIEKLVKGGINEIAVLNEEKSVIADLTMLDLLKYCHLEENK